MNANASEGAKVLPIARIPIRKTGTLSTSAEASGKSATGRQPPRRRRSQKSEGAYASEKRRAATIKDITVAPLTSAALRLAPSTTQKISRIAESPNSHEPREIDTSFISIADCRLPIANCRFWNSSFRFHRSSFQKSAIGVWQSAIDSVLAHSFRQDVLNLECVRHSQ